ncbi:MAG: amidase, partial [Candidatus Thorarchaeota archaeon]
MNEDKLCFISAYELAGMIKEQTISSEEITEITIERIQRINPIINAFCTTSFELARLMAKEADNKVRNKKLV